MARIPYTNISQLIPTQLPLVVRENYDTFVSFLKAYYEFLEQTDGVVYGINRVLSYRDIDTTLDSFLKYFQFEFMPNIPNYVMADPRKLAKRIKQFYRARGTENSYKFLFRILFNENVEFYYPKLDLLKPSDGKWTVDNIVRTTTFHNTFNFIGHQILGKISGATANVESIIQFQIGSNQVSEMYISGIIGKFILGEKIICTTVEDGTVEEELHNVVSEITVTSAGLRYKQNDEIIITGNGQSAVAAVDVVGGFEIGRAVSADNTFIQNPGPSQTVIPPYIVLRDLASDVDDYFTLMYVEIIEGPGIGEIKHIVNYDGATKLADIDSDWVVIPTVESRYKISLGQIKTIKVKDFGIDYSSVSVDCTQSGDGNATASAVVSAQAKYPGHWINTDSFLSDIKIIQDSFFWQDFSYVLKAQDSISLYGAAVKKLLHPAGTIMFGQVDIISKLVLGVDYRTYERHKFRFAPYEGFEQEYPGVNAGYWDTFGNTQMYPFKDLINGDVDSKPTTKRNLVADCFIGISIVPDEIPTIGLAAEYDCLRGTDVQVVYDIHLGGEIYDGFLGIAIKVDPHDALFTSEGLDFQAT